MKMRTQRTLNLSEQKEKKRRGSDYVEGLGQRKRGIGGTVNLPMGKKKTNGGRRGSATISTKGGTKLDRSTKTLTYPEKGDSGQGR